MRLAFAYFCIYQASPHRFVPSGGGWVRVSSTSRFAEAYSQQPVPRGLAQFFDLTFAGDGAFAAAAPFLFYAALALYAAGRLPLLATGVLLGLDTLYGTLAFSQGASHHTGQVVGLVLLGQFVYFASRWFKDGFDARRLAQHRDEVPSGAVYFSQQLLAAAYVVAGASKLMRSGLDWFSQAQNVAVQLRRNHEMDFYNTLAESPDRANALMTGLVTDFPLFATVFFGAGLVLELTAFAALFSRGLAAFYGITLLLLHEGISAMMHLGFAFNKAVLVIFFINLPFWAVAAWRRVRGLGGIAQG
jgi:hypothetical protein